MSQTARRTLHGAVMVLLAGFLGVLWLMRHPVPALSDPAEKPSAQESAEPIVLELEGVTREIPVTLPPGGRLLLQTALSKANPYEAKLASYGRDHLKFVSERKEGVEGSKGKNGKPLLGAPDERQVFEFRAGDKADGAAKIVVELRRPWEKQASTRYTVAVKIGKQVEPSKEGQPIWHEARQDSPVRLFDPLPDGWNDRHHELAIDYDLSISPDGAINVELSNLHPRDGVPADQTVDADSTTDTGPDKPQPTPIEYRWRNCTIEPSIKYSIDQDVNGNTGKITRTWVEGNISIKLVGTARELRGVELMTDYDTDSGFEHDLYLPLYGPDFEVSAELTLTSFRALSKEVPALNQIPKAKFHVGTLTKVSYAREREVAIADTRDEEFTNRTFLKAKKGMVRVKRAGGDWVKAEDNMDLNIGDMVKTLVNGKAEVVLAGTAVIRIKPNSEFIIPENKANTKEKVSFIQMLKGVLWAKAKNEDDSLKVATPNAICGGGRLHVDMAVAYYTIGVESKYAPSFENEEVEQKESTTCVYCYDGKVAVWKTTARDELGTPLAELSPNESVCVGPRGVIAPDPDSKPELGTCNFAGLWDVSYYDSPEPTGKPTRKVRMKIEVADDKATGSEELRGMWIKTLEGPLAENAQVWTAQQMAANVVVLTVADIHFDPNCDRIVGEWSGAVPHHNAWIATRVGADISTEDGELPKELTVELSSKDRTPTVHVAPGATVKVKVATYAGTGYQMNMVPLDRGGLTQTGGPVDEAMKRPAGKNVVGAGTWKVYDFKVPEKARGKFPIKFQFSRGRGKVEVEYTLTVEVGN